MTNNTNGPLYVFFLSVVFLVVALCVIIIFSNNNEIETNIYDVTQNSEEEPKMEELFENYYDEAEKMLASMSLEEKVGQMFLVRYSSKDVVEEIKNENPGGYILFAKDFQNKTREEVIEEIELCQENSNIKLFIGVDEEGGKVVRVSKFSEFRDEPFKSSRELYLNGGFESIINDSKEKSSLLKSLGINMNLAPVVDVTTDENSFMYSRSLGENANITAEYAEKVIETMNDDLIVSVMKHFPRIWK